MGFLRWMECLVLTCLGSAPFLAVLTYELDPVTDLRACSKPCCFIRVSATETLPESIAANLQDLPTFVGVENDRNFSVAPPKAKVDWHGITLITQIHPASLGWISSETKEFPNPHVNELVCETEHVRKKIENRPNQAWTIKYIFSLVMWTMMKMAHDWALLGGLQDELTLPIGLVSWVFQVLASSAVFDLIAATNVFISRVPEQNGTCFYQFAPSATLKVLSVQLLLLYLAHVKLNNLLLSLVNGDYLYYKTFDVFYQVVKDTAPSHPFLTQASHGDFDVPSDLYEQGFRNRISLCIFARALYCCYYSLLIGFVLPFDFFANLFLCMTEMAVSHAWSLGPMAFLKFAALVAAASLPVIGGTLAASMLFALIREARSEWRSLRAIAQFYPFYRNVSACFEHV